jgi:integrase
VTRQENAWKRLQPVFGQRLGTNINKDDCRMYVQLRQRHGAAAGTVRTELEYLRACLNLRYGCGHNRVWLPTGSPPRDRYLTREEVDKLLELVGTPHVRLFIILAITTGARMGALLELRWDQVDFKHRTINFNRSDREQTNKRRPQGSRPCPLPQRSARPNVCNGSKADITDRQSFAHAYRRPPRGPGRRGQVICKS